jgi:uncharacterized protein YecA (UPF0149 family)
VKTKHYGEALKKQQKHPSDLMPEAKPKIKDQKTADSELESEINNLPPNLLAKAKDPKIKDKLKKLVKKMTADGVNLKSTSQIKNWIKTHPEAVKGVEQKIETFKRPEPKIGRNDPCSCGSGKKYKKCCGC